MAIDRGDDLPLFHPVANFEPALDLAAAWGAEYPAGGITFDRAGRFSIGFGLPLVNHPSQAVAPVCFNNHVAILPGRKARPQGNHQRRIRQLGPRIDLGDNGVDQNLGLELSDPLSLGVN